MRLGTELAVACMTGRGRCLSHGNGGKPPTQPFTPAPCRSCTVHSARFSPHGLMVPSCIRLPALGLLLKRAREAFFRPVSLLPCVYQRPC
jgi:hypothetical protein